MISPSDRKQVSTIGEETFDIRDGTRRAGASAHHGISDYEASKHKVPRRTHGCSEPNLGNKMAVMQLAGYKTPGQEPIT